MGGRNGRGPVRRKTVKASEFPQVFVDAGADFASIKIAPGVEARSYEKKGFVFCEDAGGNVIEVQLLNLSSLKGLKRTPAAFASRRVRTRTPRSRIPA
jgi:hypothetical protein